MKLQVGDIVEVQGFVMLAKLEPGRYRIKATGTWQGIPYYDFAKPKGKKTVVRHSVASVDFGLSDAENPDLNKMFKV